MKTEKETIGFIGTRRHGPGNGDKPSQGPASNGGYNRTVERQDGLYWRGGATLARSPAEAVSPGRHRWYDCEDDSGSRGRDLGANGVLEQWGGTASPSRWSTIAPHTARPAGSTYNGSEGSRLRAARGLRKPDVAAREKIMDRFIRRCCLHMRGSAANSGGGGRGTSTLGDAPGTPNEPPVIKLAGNFMFGAARNRARAEAFTLVRKRRTRRGGP